jgi:hypothetical protein
VSDPREPAFPPPATPRRTRSVALRILLIVCGIVLLFPGLCSLFFMAVFFGDDPASLFSEPGWVVLWVSCLAISVGGILLIWDALRRQ